MFRGISPPIPPSLANHSAVPGAGGAPEALLAKLYEELGSAWESSSGGRWMCFPSPPRSPRYSPPAWEQEPACLPLTPLPLSQVEPSPHPKGRGGKAMCLWARKESGESYLLWGFKKIPKIACVCMQMCICEGRSQVESPPQHQLLLPYPTW